MQFMFWKNFKTKYFEIDEDVFEEELFEILHEHGKITKLDFTVVPAEIWFDIVNCNDETQFILELAVFNGFLIADCSGDDRYIMEMTDDLLNKIDINELSKYIFNNTPPIPERIATPDLIEAVNKLLVKINYQNACWEPYLRK